MNDTSIEHHGRYPFRRQKHPAGCARACVEMILVHFKVRISEAQLSRVLADSPKGHSLESVINACNGFGIGACAGRIELNVLFDENHNWQFPCIAHCLGNHYCVIYNVERSKAVVADPLNGWRLLSKDAFSYYWSAVSNTPSLSGVVIVFQNENTRKGSMGISP